MEKQPIDSVQVPSDDDLRAMWRKEGGRFHGPNVETGTMPDHLLLPLLRRLINEAKAVSAPGPGKQPDYLLELVGLVTRAARDGFDLRVTQVSDTPFAMGHHHTRMEVLVKRRVYDAERYERELEDLFINGSSPCQ